MNRDEIRHIGDDALALKVEGRTERHAIARHLRETGTWMDVVPGKLEVSVQFDPYRFSPAAARERLVEEASEATLDTVNALEPVNLVARVGQMDSPDLEAVCAANDLSVDEFLRRIEESPLIVDMMGFQPGFAYVAGVDAELRAERLAMPRQRVAAGSVGFLTGQVGLYSLAGPGGWPIIGRITEALFDRSASHQFLLAPGVPIRLKFERSQV